MQNIEQLYKEYFNTINKYLFCLTHDSDLSEDLTQETFCKAIKSINTYKGNCKISVWLCQIAKNLWFDYCKKNRRISNLDIFDYENFFQAENLEEIVISNNEKNILYNKLLKLDRKTREVIYLRITGELSFKEISNVLNKSEAWTRVTFYRGKNQLKEDDEYE